MTTEQLKQILFGEVANVFAILDGASVKGLRTHLFEKQPPNYCLFRGELAPDMAEVAPYLVGLIDGTPFTDWLLSEKPGAHYGIFAQTRVSMIEMRRHFRQLTTVYNEDGNPMIFRYYDPRVLHQYLPTCNPGELRSFFGSVDKFFAETEDGEGFSSFSIAGNQLRHGKLNGEQN
jgi:hypothetical protein